MGEFVGFGFEVRQVALEALGDLALRAACGLAIDRNYAWRAAALERQLAEMKEAKGG